MATKERDHHPQAVPGAKLVLNWNLIPADHPDHPEWERAAGRYARYRDGKQPPGVKEAWGSCDRSATYVDEPGDPKVIIARKGDTVEVVDRVDFDQGYEDWVTIPVVLVNGQKWAILSSRRSLFK